MTTTAEIRYRQFPLRRFITDITDGPFGSALTSSHYADEGARVIRLGNVGSAVFKDMNAAYISLDYFKELRRHEVLPGDLIIAGLGDGNHPVGRACVAPGHLGPAIVKADCFRVRLDEKRLTHRYAAWALSSSFVSDQVSSLTRGSTRARINLEVVRDIQLPIPSMEEQRRVASFLDAETAHIDRLAEMRKAQIELLDLRLTQLVDGVVAGDRDALNEIGGGCEQNTWQDGKVSRFCEVIPGYAFPSSGFLTEGGGVRLLRGINIAPGRIVWGDVEYWDVNSAPVPHRFALREGDLVVGMDRPWVAGGARIASIRQCDLPALLLQRVACLRPKSPNINTKFIYWVLRSTQFRLAVESEMTGVSVPHLSGDQIGGFRFKFPELQAQENLATALEAQAAKTEELKTAISEQVALLAERRQALITAAVTGHFDVTTAGRSSAI
ncbi:hypothetical protein GT045_28100 [Streptomyces sp. SID486]|uniref:restriction endonuclease subunit S n=1 Tax=Streptomyces sp. SID486 TaxID=2690264 RepID=UPI00136E461F|nr:hypothetical protein [Streptomyces sp. SID2955]MYX98560.1 hypothetical protein [Streptomyces sp. SID486]